MVKSEKMIQAVVLLDQGRSDEAIDILRSDQAPQDAAVCALLARAYYQRGDTRGDIYSSHFFAQRAMALGEKTAELAAICALGAFRKESCSEAANEFAKFVTPDSSAATQYLLGLALIYSGQGATGQEWVERAKKKDPAGLKAFIREEKYLPKENFFRKPATGNMYESVIEQLKALDEKQIPAPYDHQPLSVLRGQGSDAKDFDWSAKNVPCQQACPAATDIPEYLNAIFKKEYERAYRINLQANVFPAVLGRVCARPCEDSCRHGWPGLGQPVAICWSKRAAADHKSTGMVRLETIFPASGKKVVVVGAGVAGLTVARQLALLGHEVIVYEKHKNPGGMMNQGIPEFRLPRDVIRTEIEQVKACGVKIACGKEIGKDILLEDLQQKFDAVVLAAGTLRPNRLDLPGAQLQGIFHGLDFLLQANEFGCRDIGKKVIVIGGGFTAMDCARTAWRLGADSVRVLYRRSEKEMLITPGELEELAHEGIPMDFMVSPVAYLGEGQVRAVQFIKNELGEPDASGRRRPLAIKGSEFDLAADTVLLATGQFPDTSWIKGSIKEKLLNAKGEWLIPGAQRTAQQKIFLSGDFSQGAASLIRAIGHAKTTAVEVDVYLTGKARQKEVVVVADAPDTGRIREMDAVPQMLMPSLAKAQRTFSAEVEQGFGAALSKEETQRCYLCHYKFEIDHDKCIYCDWCIKAKPRPNCILKVKQLVKDPQGRTVGFDLAKTSEEAKFIYINQEDCIRCHACVQACPVGCISVQKVSRQTETCGCAKKGK